MQPPCSTRPMHWGVPAPPHALEVPLRGAPRPPGVQQLWLFLPAARCSHMAEPQPWHCEGGTQTLRAPGPPRAPRQQEQPHGAAAGPGRTRWPPKAPPALPRTAAVAAECRGAIAPSATARCAPCHVLCSAIPPLHSHPSDAAGAMRHGHGCGLVACRLRDPCGCQTPHMGLTGSPLLPPSQVMQSQDVEQGGTTRC